MPTFTVHQPPLRNGEDSVDPERFVFVRDGFHFWAFVLAPLWMLTRRLWLVLLLYVVLSAVLAGIFYAINAPPAVRFAVGVPVALLIGFEAATLQRWTLARRGWRSLGIVVGDDREIAEQRFFSQWVEHRSEPAAPSASLPVTPPQRAAASNSVIGSFPEPGARR